ncbi:MAG: SGNH/GDSL hydrolase family protein [Planctomycetota bacterium]
MRLAPDDERLRYLAPQGARHGSAGTRLERFPQQVQRILQGQIGPLANMRSSAGCALLLRTDAPRIILHLTRLRHHQHAPVGLDCEVEGLSVSHSADLRECEGDVVISFATGLERGGELRQCRLWWPLISTCALRAVELPHGSTVEATDVPEPAWLAIGDSLSQGFSVQAPTQHWLHRVSRALGLPVWNLGLGGLRIEHEPFRWALEQRQWRLISIGLGSNHAWNDADVERVTDAAEGLLELVLSSQPRARICWLMPPWKALEAGKGPSDFMGVPLDRRAAARLAQIRADVRRVLARHPQVQVVDDLLPADHRLLPDGLHPGAVGMAHYAERLQAVLE